MSTYFFFQLCSIDFKLLPWCLWTAVQCNKTSNHGLKKKNEIKFKRHPSTKQRLKRSARIRVASCKVIRDLDSGIQVIRSVESRIHGFGIRNPANGISFNTVIIIINFGNLKISATEREQSVNSVIWPVNVYLALVIHWRIKTEDHYSVNVLVMSRKKVRHPSKSLSQHFHLSRHSMY